MSFWPVSPLPSVGNPCGAVCKHASKPRPNLWWTGFTCHTFTGDTLVLPLETKITAAFSQHNRNQLLKQNHLIKILLIVIPYSSQEDDYKYTIKRSSFCLLKFYIKEILLQSTNQYVTLVQNRQKNQEPS